VWPLAMGTLAGSSPHKLEERLTGIEQELKKLHDGSSNAAASSR
jgi:hypothetical protein